MSEYMIINATDSQLVDVNVGGTDIEPFSYKDEVQLTNSELESLLSTQGVCVTGSGSSEQLRLAIKRVIRRRST